MNRSFSPLDLVTVPRTSAASAMALGTALVTAARQEPDLPARFARPLERLESECEALRTSRRQQAAAREFDANAVGKADQLLDGAWSGLHSFLVGWTKLSATPEGVDQGARARAVLGRVFPAGLRFLNLPYRDQWAESQTKLDRLAEPSVAEHVTSLGGDAFVRAIELAHAKYGEALHVTKRKAEARVQIKVREPIERVLDAVRRYVVHVAAHVDEREGDPAAQALGYALLEPLATWKSSGGGRRAASGGAPGGDAGGEPGGGPSDGDAEPRE